MRRVCANLSFTWATVQALSQKYKTAELALETVVPAFEGLTSSVGDPSWIAEWELLEAKAMEMRGEAMMIYNVSPVQGAFNSVTQVRFSLCLLLVP